MARCFADYGGLPARPGELSYLALYADEPPVKRGIAPCRARDVPRQTPTRRLHDLLDVPAGAS